MQTIEMLLQPRLQARGGVFLSSRCFVCRQSKRQLEEERKRSLYGLESAGNVAGPAPRGRGRGGPARGPGLAPPPFSAGAPASTSAPGRVRGCLCQPLGKRGDFVEGPIVPRPSELPCGASQAPVPRMVRNGGQRVGSAGLQQLFVDAEI